VKLTRLLPAPVHPHTRVARVPLNSVPALVYLLGGCALTVLTHRTNPGPLAIVGGLLALGLLLLAVHRHDQPAITAIDTVPDHTVPDHTVADRTWGPWLRTAAATLTWASLILAASTAAELALRALTGSAHPLPETGPTVLLPGLAPTLAILTSTLLGWARLRPRGIYTTAACVAVLTTLAAQGWDATSGALPAAAATVALTWLYRRTHRGLAVYLAGGVTALAAAAVLVSPGSPFVHSLLGS